MHAGAAAGAAAAARSLAPLAAYMCACTVWCVTGLGAFGCSPGWLTGCYSRTRPWVHGVCEALFSFLWGWERLSAGALPMHCMQKGAAWMPTGGGAAQAPAGICFCRGSLPRVYLPRMVSPPCSLQQKQQQWPQSVFVAQENQQLPDFQAMLLGDGCVQAVVANKVAA